ncbi:Eukaryotic translation initiation factor 3 subunit I [Zancudomyces culisetae]|uniref:Eukaryotic translation initiation factor 3 subunit I n=1 Tax=Zancudomyces culisetae TaxID=1213189 RepID=A0A1R1PZF5_ZANCU|nr:Eukaryotic translation initiation factor 3 subunit I [Zancudomyces culisetae]|eukprot:OMH86352.1 Eukaryotic translation initiation factor 3 subunit I [Zancudomyces culisetae]
MRPILLKGHTRPITQIKYNREGDLLFTVAKDMVVNAWYAHNGERLGTFDGHKGSVWSIAVDSSSTLLATGSADNTAKIWRIRDGKCLETLEFNAAVRKVEFSTDDKYLSVMLDNHMGQKSEIFVYRVVRSGSGSSEVYRMVRPNVAEHGRATVQAWAYYNKYIIVGHVDGTVCQYEFSPSDQQQSGSLKLLKSKKIHNDEITDLQFSADRSYFITSSKDKTANLVDVETLDILKIYKSDTSLNTAALVAKKDYIVVGGGQAASEVTTTGARQGKFEARFFHMIFEHEIGRVKGHFGPINTLSVEPNGLGYSSGGEDGFVRIHYFDDDYFGYKYDY